MEDIVYQFQKMELESGVQRETVVHNNLHNNIIKHLVYQNHSLRMEIQHLRRALTVSTSKRPQWVK